MEDNLFRRGGGQPFAHFQIGKRVLLGPPVVTLFWRDPTKIDVQKNCTLILTSLLEDLVFSHACFSHPFVQSQFGQPFGQPFVHFEIGKRVF